MSKRKKYYAVAKGRKTGIFETWEECSKQVVGFASARYKSFRTKAEALGFIESSQDNKSSAPPVASGANKKKTNERCDNVKVQPTSDPGVEYRPTKRPKIEVHQAPAPAVPLRNPYTQTFKDIILLPPHPSLPPATRPVVHRESSSSVVAPPPPTQSTATNRKLKVHISFDGGSRGNPGLAGGSFTLVFVIAAAPSTLGDRHPHRLTVVFACIPSLCDALAMTPAGAVITLQEQCASQVDGPPFRRTLRVRDFLLHQATNNEAEYHGVLVGLTVALNEVKRYARGHNDVVRPTPLRIHLVIQGDSQLIVKQVTGVYQCRNAKLKPLFAKVKSLLSEFQGLGDCQVSVEHVYREFNSHADALANEAMDAQRSWMTIDNDAENQIELG